MTPQQMQLVKDSFAKVVAIKAEAAALFYHRLFELDPSLRPLFKSDIAARGAKLMAALGGVVASGSSAAGTRATASGPTTTRSSATP
jgi:hemoglobin-like flavoprotein